jgi:hypothetical protein
MRFGRGSAIGLFAMFGRSSDLRQLDDALRAVDVHPRLLSDAIKLAAVRFLKESNAGEDPEPESYHRAGALLGYCVIGANAFAGANGERAAEAVEQRIEWALDADDSLDAKLLLLTLHAKAIQPSVVEAFGLASE